MLKIYGIIGKVGLLIRNTHAKYESSISYGKKLYTMLKFADGQTTDGLTDKQTDRQIDY